jgi:hypothetical protein
MLRQVFLSFGAGLNLFSNYTDQKKLNHSLNFSYNYLADHYESREHQIFFKASMDKNVRLIENFDKQRFGLAASLDFYDNKDSLGSSRSGLLTFQPFIEGAFNEYSFYVGMKASVELDSTSKVHLYPLAEVNIHIIENILLAYIGISGDIKRNSFSSLSRDNPFIVSVIPMDYTRNRFKLYGGISTHIGKNIDVNASLSSSVISSMPFFVNDTSTQRNKDLQNQFTVVYDDVKEIKGKVDFMYQATDRFTLLLAGNFYQYFMDDEVKAWHTPPYDVSLTGKYTIRDKFLIYSGIRAYGRSYARTFEANEVVAKKLNGFVDVSLGMEYRYSKKLAGFIDLNNITNIRYSFWNNYPGQKLNFMIGASYSF